MVKGIEDLFPSLKVTPYKLTSPTDPSYNCIAWAAGDASHWWWPEPGDRGVWPAGAPHDETIVAVHAAFKAIGYTPSSDDVLETGFEKVAIFADADGFPTHAARQLTSGRWTSKLGELEDIEHDLHALAGVEYGSVVLLLKRPLPTATPA